MSDVNPRRNNQRQCSTKHDEQQSVPDVIPSNSMGLESEPDRSSKPLQVAARRKPSGALGLSSPATLGGSRRTAHQPIRELASGLRRLANDAHRIYADEVAAIIRTRCQDSSRIENTFDGLLGFCYEERMVDLYKALGRYYYPLNPRATIEYVHAYRDMWDTGASDV